MPDACYEHKAPRFLSPKCRPLVDNEHVGQDGPLGLGPDGAYVMYCVRQCQRCFVFFSSSVVIINKVEIIYVTAC